MYIKCLLEHLTNYTNKMKTKKRDIKEKSFDNVVEIPVAKTIDVSPRPDLKTEKKDDMNVIKRMYFSTILPFVRKNIDGKMTVLSPPSQGKIAIDLEVELSGITIIKRSFVLKY